MDIPSGGILGLLRVLFRPVADFFGMLFFYRAYEISTLHRNHREAFGLRPHHLVDGIEYKIIWKPYHLRKKLVTPMIWLRATNKNRFAKVVLAVTASNRKIRYQDHVTLFDVAETPTQTALPSVPFRSLTFDGNLVYTPYDHIQTKVLELYDSNGNKLHLHRAPEKLITPFDRLEVALGLEKGDVEKWGEVFNLEFIEAEIKSLRTQLIGSAFHSSRPVYVLRSSLFGVGWVVRAVFWVRNLVFARQLTRALTRYLEDHAEQMKWERENLTDDSRGLLSPPRS